MRVALVHDWLTVLRGGERCLDRIAGLFPGADLFTLVHVPGATTSRIDALHIHTSALGRLPFAARHYRKLLPLFPNAIESFDLSSYDLVVSSSHAVAKGVRTRPDQPHLCYCFTPMRYVWDQADAYLGRGLRRALAMPLVSHLRRFDLAGSGPERVTRFVAISSCVAERIRRHYGREATVVFPPVEIERFVVGPRQSDRQDYYVMVGGFVPYKREELAVRAFGLPTLAGRRLVVLGDGPGRQRAARNAPPNVEFRGRVSDAELADWLRNARALLYPQVEDFGIVAVEAQACGTPVIAFGAGGALDSILPADTAAQAPTGLFFDQPVPEALAAAIQRFEVQRESFDPAAIRKWAERFGATRFDRELRAEIDSMLDTREGERGTAHARP